MKLTVSSCLAALSGGITFALSHDLQLAGIVALAVFVLYWLGFVAYIVIDEEL